MASFYFDYMSTTPVDPQVAALMAQYLGAEGCFGNSASKHSYGEQAQFAIATARAQVAKLVQAKPEEIIWTSGATEANNLALFGAARFYQRQGKHIITLQTEHKAVLNPCRQLEREGFTVSYLRPDSQGLLSVDALAEAIRPDTILISIMQVNNETGVIQDIGALARLAKQKGIIFHSDAAQSVGKIAIDLQTLPVDLMSFSAHKVYGPKGVGALFVRQKPRVRLQPLLYGGGQEQGLRSGTLATHQLIGMGCAFAIAQQNLAAEQLRIGRLRDRLLRGIEDIPGVYLNGAAEQRVAENINLSVAGVDGESLLLALHDLALSQTSACASASMEPSYVLRALGVSEQLAHSSFRLSLGRYTTEQEVDIAIALLQRQIRQLRELSPC